MSLRTDLFPFARLNLRRNPFAELADRDRPRAAVVELDVDALVARLARPGFAVELLGEAGRGKSTHLSVLHARFPSMPRTYLPEEPPLPSIPHAAVVFVDESQRLSRSERARLFAREASFVLATHECHERELRDAGLEVCTHHVGGLDLARLRAIVARRIELARLGAGPLPTIPALVLEEQLRIHGDDLRAIGGDLYDWVQRHKDGEWC